MCSATGVRFAQTSEILRVRCLSGLWMVIFLLSRSASAELVTIYDNGRTHSLTPLLSVLPSPQPTPVAVAPGDLGAADPARWLPLRSPGLSPGPVTHRPLPALYQGTLTRPVFLVGADLRSQAWLQQHRDMLRSLGAVGLLVQAETEQDLNTIATLAAGLPVLPAGVTDLVQTLELTHIPVLISRRGIEQ